MMAMRCDGRVYTVGRVQVSKWWEMLSKPGTAGCRTWAMTPSSPDLRCRTRLQPSLGADPSRQTKRQLQTAQRHHRPVTRASPTPTKTIAETHLRHQPVQIMVALLFVQRELGGCFQLGLGDVVSLFELETLRRPLLVLLLPSFMRTRTCQFGARSRQ